MRPRRSSPKDCFLPETRARARAERPKWPTPQLLVRRAKQAGGRLPAMAAASCASQCSHARAPGGGRARPGRRRRQGARRSSRVVAGVSPAAGAGHGTSLDTHAYGGRSIPSQWLLCRATQPDAALCGVTQAWERSAPFSPHAWHCAALLPAKTRGVACRMPARGEASVCLSLGLGLGGVSARGWLAVRGLALGRWAPFLSLLHFSADLCCRAPAARSVRAGG